MGILDRLRRRRDDEDTDYINLTERLGLNIAEPHRCPECDGRGYVDHVDVADGSSLQHCLECGVKYEVRPGQIHVVHRG